MSSQMRFSLRSGGEFGDAMSAFSFDYVENVTLAGYRFLVRFYFRRRQRIQPVAQPHAGRAREVAKYSGSAITNAIFRRHFP